MLPNAFIGKTEPPTDAELTAELGVSRPLWDDALARLAAECNVVDQEWNSYSAKAGWALRLKVKKRNILYLSPSRGAFRVTFILGDRAINAARTSKLPAALKRLIDAGQRYPEGTGIRLDVNTDKDIDAIVKLAAIKLQN